MTTIAQQPTSAGTAEGVSRYIARAYGGEEGAIQGAMERAFEDWRYNMESCLADSDVSIDEAEVHWPRCFQLFIENRFTKGAGEQPPWAKEGQGRGWMDDLTSQKGVWIAAALIRNPDQNWTSDYIFFMDSLLEEDSTGTITYKSAATLLMHVTIWQKLGHLQQKPVSILDQFRAAVNSLLSEMERKKQLKKSIESAKGTSGYDEELSKHLAQYILNST